MFSRWRCSRVLGDSGTQTGARAPVVVVGNPLAKNRTQVALAERDHEIQTLPPDGFDQSFTEAVRLRSRTSGLDSSSRAVAPARFSLYPAAVVALRFGSESRARTNNSCMVVSDMASAYAGCTRNGAMIFLRQY